MGQINPIDIQIDHHQETLDKQKLDKIIQHPNFVIAWRRADSYERAIATHLINTLDAKGIASWIRRLIFGELQALTTKELKQQASNYHIANYSRLNKEELINILEGVIDG